MGIYASLMCIYCEDERNEIEMKEVKEVKDVKEVKEKERKDEDDNMIKRSNNFL